MKIFLTAAVICLCIAPTYQLSLTGDFITGFESGIFLRSNPNMMNDYGCPEAVSHNEQFRSLQSMISPIRLMSGMLQDKNLDHIISTVEVFVGNLSSLMAVFDGYEGGDFCSGLVFGSKGAHMLAEIAQTAFEVLLNPKNQNTQSFKF